MKDQWPDRPPRVVAVRPLDGYCLELTFNNGTVGTADLADLIVDADGVFLPLRDKLFFDQVRLSDGGTIEWPNGVDLCPDVLYSRVTGIAIPFAQTENADAA